LGKKEEIRKHHKDFKVVAILFLVFSKIVLLNLLYGGRHPLGVETP
jgi:hypothetical protein